MSFAENLKQIRKEHHLSQEDLAEMLDVSRQAVSKWEQGDGYPEVEKLLLLAKKLHVSLDALMSQELEPIADSETAAEPARGNAAGNIVITSLHENVIASCYKVMSSARMKGGKNAPKYALFGMERGGSRFWGEPTVFLGWYAEREQISREIEEIHKAIAQGLPTYTLQYSAKTQRSWASVKIVEE